MPWITFVRRGAFNYREGRHAHDFHSGVVLLGSGRAEYVVTHFRGVRDECTIIVLPGLLANATTFAPDGRFVALPATPVLAHLHHSIRAATRTGGAARLQADELVGAVVREVVRLRGGGATSMALDRKTLVRYHDLIDCAKEFMHDHHARDVALAEVAHHACMSPFHFSRVFKRVTGMGPHRYLTGIRLERAALLLRDTPRSVTDICFTTGFNSLEHFIPAFRARYGMSPSAYRKTPEKSKNP